MATLPSNWRVPSAPTTFDIVSGYSGLVPTNDKVLLIGQFDSAIGQALPNTLYEVFTLTEGETYFGKKTVLYSMLKAFFAVNKNVSVWCIAMEEHGSGTAATATTIFTCASGGDGYYYSNVGGEYFEDYAASFTDWKTVIKDNINNSKNIPYTCDWSSLSLVMTASNTGKSLNACPMYFEFSNNLDVSCAAPEYTAGTNSPDWSTVLDLIEDREFTVVVFPEMDATSTAEFKSYVETYCDPLHQPKMIGVFGCNGVLAAYDTPSEVTTWVDTNINSWKMYMPYYPKTNNLDCAIGSAFAAALIQQSRPGDPINDYELTGLNPPSLKNKFTNTQNQALLIGGVTPIYTDGIVPKVLQARTCFIDESSVEIDKCTYFEAQRGLFYIAAQVQAICDRYVHNNLKNNAETRANLKQEIYMFLVEMEGKDYEITQNVEDNYDGIIVIENPSYASKVIVTVPSDIVLGLHVAETTIRLI